jgi:hypothetical protein
VHFASRYTMSRSGLKRGRWSKYCQREEESKWGTEDEVNGNRLLTGLASDGAIGLCGVTAELFKHVHM